MSEPARYLKAIRHRPSLSAQAGFPFDLPLVAALDDFSLSAPVTFLVGENGCGKSTIIETMAAGMRAVAVGASDLSRDPTLKPARALAAALRFAKGPRPPRTLFFRAEDAFGFTRRVTDDIAELDAMRQSFKAEFTEGSYAQQLAMGVASGQRAALVGAYGEDPDAKSHGENFLDVLKFRIQSPGLFFLDEPETPLSPGRQLALLSLLMQHARDGSQFVIATHSPILMALPGATILLIEDGGMRDVAWEDVEHVSLTRAFLANPDSFLRHL